MQLCKEEGSAVAPDVRALDVTQKGGGLDAFRIW